MTLSELANQIKQEFATYVSGRYDITEAQIHRAIWETLFDISRFCPRLVKEKVEVDNGRADLSGYSYLWVVDVEFPSDSGKYVPFTEKGHTLILRHGGSGSATVTLGCQHTFSDTESTLDPELENLLRQGAMARVALSVSLVKADRMNPGGASASNETFIWASRLFEYYMRLLTSKRVIKQR